MENCHSNNTFNRYVAIFYNLSEIIPLLPHIQTTKSKKYLQKPIFGSIFVNIIDNHPI